MERIVLDTDLAMGAPGSDIDDGFALALAHADPNIRIDLVTTVNGNTDVETATRLTLELVRLLGIEGTRVVKGASAPLTHPERLRQPAAEVAERYGVGLAPSPGYAAAEIARHVMENPGEITIVAIGPLTNVAAAICLEPLLPGAVKEIVVMGGIFLGTMPSRRMPGEFNIWTDPEAAAAVLRSGAPLRFVGLDVTLQVRLTRQHAAEMSASSGSFSRLAGESSAAWIEHLRRHDPGDLASADSCAMHDPLAVAAVTRPDLLTWQDVAVEVVTGEGLARGVMITDLRYEADPPVPNCRIATAVDAEGFMDYFLSAVTQL